MAEWLDDFFFTYETLIHGIGVHGLLALSMYCVMAVGQLSLGQAAFMGLGAYTGALLTLKLGLPFYVVLPASAFVPALIALLIGGPTLRLSGVYLAISTVGLGEVLRVIYINFESLTGGALGLSGIPMKASVSLIYALLLIALIMFWAVGRSRIGRAMEAMREDEVAAGVMGINVPVYKLGALIVSAMLAGIAGCLAAHSSSFIGPNEYGFETAVTILSFALLGGIGTPLAPVLGALVLTALPEVLRPLADFRLVINGMIIVVAILFLPRGVLPLRLRRSA
ncbi:branched-chain amino acid ABC transporter permease [Roseibium suaedae]|uniref:Amino acid/amide ABC transporter membrane protein 2, HAAT family n=1 Tax=Roseibium suaedae TaxID=735517 RepID=A0A1M7P6A9_9HYPH|nr:branched-chain amino acid ABC transporter permease [Roseibium suaedae]SHN12095.1 amino acid/amide ABC transporter membrane protein 2, HAAT family [Roseibium suaedae]